MVDGVVVQFVDVGADLVKEVAVVCDHEERERGDTKEVFEPLDHLNVKVVGRFVEDEQLRFTQEDIGKGHTLLLSARELVNGLAEVMDVQFAEYLSNPRLVVPVVIVRRHGASVKHGDTFREDRMLS